MVDRLEIVNKSPDSALEKQRNNKGQFCRTASSPIEVTSLQERRQRIESLLYKGIHSAEIEQELGITRQLLWADMKVIGTALRKGYSDPDAAFAVVYGNYISKRSWLLEEIKHAKNPYVTIRAVETLDLLDKNFNDYCFKSGVLRQTPTAETKEINVRFCTTDEDLARLAARAKNTREHAVDAEFTCESSSEAGGSTEKQAGA